MRKGLAILLAIWATAACTAIDGNATAPTAAPSAMSTAAVPEITPAPVGPPVRVLWAPRQPQPLPIAVRVDPGATAARMPALVPASPEQLTSAEPGFVQQFTRDFIGNLTNLREGRLNGGEEWQFSTMFAPGPFADRVRELLTTRRENELRTFHPGQATLERAWVRPWSGLFGPTVELGLVEGTVTFTDEVVTGGDRTTETHTWRIRALSQGVYYILDGAEAPAQRAPMAPFDPTTLDAELATQLANHLHTEEVGPLVMPIAPYKGTPYWDARGGALDWLHELGVRGTLTDRHFEGMQAQVLQFRPTSYLGDGYVTVRLRGTLIEVMNGVRHAYPVNESAVFQRFSFAQPFWIAVDGQNDDGTWIANGNYGTPQQTAHG